MLGHQQAACSSPIHTGSATEWQRQSGRPGRQSHLFAVDQGEHRDALRQRLPSVRDPVQDKLDAQAGSIKGREATDTTQIPLLYPLPWDGMASLRKLSQRDELHKNQPRTQTAKIFDKI